MEIVTLRQQDEQYVLQAANLLVDGFSEHWPDAWPTLESACQEVEECLAAERICRVAIDGEGTVLGWIGGIPQYKGNVWELHPIVVVRGHRRQGIGRALIADLEEQVRMRGGLTIQLGTDDEDAMTSLSGVDLYEDLWQKIRTIRNFKGHPYTFYQRCGFTIIGVMPDANGVGKPDIYMAKRVGSLA